MFVTGGDGMNINRKFMLILFILVISFSCVAMGSTRKKEEVIYEVVEIKEGDTLWDIACVYKSEGVSTKKYVAQIQDFNGMKTDKIIAGQSVIVPVTR